jgi:hypothetical protein
MVYLVSRALGVLGTVAQSVTMGWQVYDLSRAERGVAESALYVGLLGQAVPVAAAGRPARVNGYHVTSPSSTRLRRAAHLARSEATHSAAEGAWHDEDSESDFRFE